MIVRPELLAFRPLTSDDLPLLYRWLNEAHVARWYRDEAGRPFAMIARRYDPSLRAEEGILQFAITYDGQAIGQIQTYMVTDPAEYGGPAYGDPGAAAMDLLIGEPAYAHQGLGAPIIRCFLREVVFGTLGATCCLIDPERDNSVAIRCYLKAGFRTIATFHRPGSQTEMVLMGIDRAEMLAADPAVSTL